MVSCSPSPQQDLFGVDELLQKKSFWKADAPLLVVMFYLALNVSRRHWSACLTRCCRFHVNSLSQRGQTNTHTSSLQGCNVARQLGGRQWQGSIAFVPCSKVTGVLCQGRPSFNKPQSVSSLLRQGPLRVLIVRRCAVKGNTRQQSVPKQRQN